MPGVFSSLFSPVFSGAADANPVEKIHHQPSFQLETRVGVDSVFAAGHYVGWSLTVMIGAVDVSARLSGTMQISGGEESARTAQFSVTPLSAAELLAYESAAVTVDITVFRLGYTATYRRFTGTVEDWDFSESDLLVDVSCRDGYQERIKAAGQEAIHAMFGGLHTESAALVSWSSDTPDPQGYFSKLLATVPGSVFIDGNGIWRAFRWEIGTPRASFGMNEYFDGSLTTSSPARVDVPAAIDASLTVRVNRLHSVEVPLSWEGVSYVDYSRGLGLWAGKSSVKAVLDGLSGWFVKGTPAMVSPEDSYLIPTSGGGVYSMLVADADKTCISFSATMYKRWYQEVDYVFKFTIDLGGLSDRDDSISEAITSSWDPSTWEDVQATDNGVSIYIRNAPTVAVEKTGYEALPEPWPPANGAMDYYPDLSGDLLGRACTFVGRRALRLAAAGQRKRLVSFSRPVDPRWDISDVLAVVGRRVSATGQVFEFTDSLDVDSGSATTEFTLACPAGDSTITHMDNLALPSLDNEVAHALPNPVLGNHLGAALGMVIADDDALLGRLSNVDAGVAQYDPTAPAYAPQFRVVMPAIAAPHRDPITIDVPLSAPFSLAKGEWVIDF